MKKKLTKIYNKNCTNNYKILKNTAYAVIDLIALMLYLDVRYDFIISCFVFIFIYFFIKTDKQVDSKIKKYSFITAILISVILSIGTIYSKYIWDVPFNVFNFSVFIKILIIFLSSYITLYRLFNILLLNVNSIKLFESKRKLSLKYLFLLWIGIFICWLPYFFRYFPARMTPDSFYVIHYANDFILSDLHTFGHTWFFGIFFHVGKFITNNLNVAVAFGTIAQMLTLSFIFAFTIKYLYQKGLKKCFCILLFLFYAFSPLNSVYSITLWRDILFGGSFVIISLYLFEYVSNNYHLKKYQLVILIITIILMLFFRNNGIYVLILMFLIILFICKKNRLKTSVIGIGIILFYFLIKGPVFNYFNVAQTKSIEAYSIPLQQISRVLYLDGNVNEKELNYLNTIIDVGNVKENYRQVISDPIKNISNGDEINNNKLKFIKNWFTILIKNPKIYIESYIYQTIGYWYPTIDYGDTSTTNQSFFEKEIQSQPITNEKINNLIDKVSSKRVPLSNFIWSIGTYFIMFILLFSLSLYNNKEYILSFIPILCLWGTIMISTPVFAELRYIYGLFVTVPLLGCIPFFKSNDDNN